MLHLQWFGQLHQYPAEAVGEVCAAAALHSTSVFALKFSDLIDDVGQSAVTSVVHDILESRASNLQTARALH